MIERAILSHDVHEVAEAPGAASVRYFVVGLIEEARATASPCTPRSAERSFKVTESS